MCEIYVIEEFSSARTKEAIEGIVFAQQLWYSFFVLDIPETVENTKV